MIRLFQSGKFWLRLGVYGTLLSCAAALGLHFLLHHLFSSRHIQNMADEAVRGSGRTVRFNADIGRSWLPRPTLTLRDVGISRPGSRADALHIGEMRIGLAWSSLWNGVEIEKWVWKNAEAELVHRADGSWNLQDLWQRRGGSWRTNRLIVENGRLNLHLPEGSYRTDRLNLNLGEKSQTGRPFQISGQTRRHDTAFAWKSSGQLQDSDGRLLLPALHLEAEVPFQNETVRLAADADAVWQPQTATLNLTNLGLRADSPRYRFHLNARSPAAAWQNGRFSAAEVGSVFTAVSDGSHWDGSLALSRISLHSGGASVGEFNFNGSHKNSVYQTTLSLSGPLLWQKTALLESERLTLSTRQNGAGATPDTRFSSQMEGRFTLRGGRNWQLAFKGLLDRQTVSLTADYAAASDGLPARLSAAFDAQKISLAPYWRDLQAQDGKLFPALFNHRLMPHIEAHARIGSLTMPGLQLDNLSTTLHADSRRITLTNFRAGLYGGHTEGGISIANTDPPAYRLQQNAQGVQIRPLLQNLLGYHGISGSGDAVIDLSAKGLTRSGLTQTLNGSLQLNISNGAWLGVDLAGYLQNLRNSAGGGQNRSNPQMQTPFRSFTLNSEISAGIGRHEHAELEADTFSISSSGQTDLNAQTVSENVLIRNTANPAAKPIPLKISGPVNNPSVTLDYNRLTFGLNAPEEKQRAIAEILREQWQWLNTPRGGTERLP